MALLEAKVRDQTVTIDGYPIPWQLSTLRVAGLVNGGGVTIGFWPEDIGFSTQSAPDFASATLWATDFRGKDQAVEVRFGMNRVRKVVSTDFRLAQGDPCFLHLDPAKAFVFASSSGARLRPGPDRCGRE
jgi:ABC-type sugar transport system ATPase subunit